jgi:YHS domain-containing protein/uncharacterized membrane protein YraQ (UPF0718 family)
MGWQFAASEFVGGLIMIGLLASLGGLWFRGRLVVSARERLQAGASSDHHMGPPENVRLQQQPWSSKLRSAGGWADSATYTMADLTMIRRELVIGYVVAGFLATVVPAHLWNVVFLHGHGFWTSLENVIVGPLIALVSCVCSVGNVPLAAALWHGGISFGGVISFIFADLIALPILLIYRRYYGTGLTLRLLAFFWLIMATAGMLTEGIFRASGLAPKTRPDHIVPEHFSWNYTTDLNIAFLLVFGLLYWIYRNRDRLGGGGGYARDPVCGMQVVTATAPANVTHRGHDYHFCSDRCADRFEADPDRYRERVDLASPMEMRSDHAGFSGTSKKG